MKRPTLIQAAGAFVAGFGIGAAIELLAVVVESVRDRAQDDLDAYAAAAAAAWIVDAEHWRHMTAIAAAEANGWYQRAGELADELRDERDESDELLRAVRDERDELRAELASVRGELPAPPAAAATVFPAGALGDDD